METVQKHAFLSPAVLGPAGSAKFYVRPELPDYHKDLVELNLQSFIKRCFQSAYVDMTTAGIL